MVVTIFQRIADGEISACHHEVTGNKIEDKNRKAVDNAVKTVKNRMPDAISTAMDNVAVPRVEMAVRSITG